MPSAHELAGIAFGVAWVVAFGSMILSLGEWLGIVWFTPWVYRRGLVAFSDEQPLPPPGGRFSPRQIVETDHGKFCFVGPEECLFRSKFSWYRRKPLPLKGTIRWSGDRAHLQARVPITLTCFVVACASGWMLGPIMMVAKEGLAAAPFGVGIAALVLLVIGVSLIVGLVMETDRLRSAVGELAVALQTSVNSPTAAGPKRECDPAVRSEETRPSSGPAG